MAIERKKAGISQAELARRIGANPTSISRIESGKEPPFRLRSKRIADALGWKGSEDELFADVEQKEIK